MRQKKKKTGTKRIENNQLQMFKKLYKKSVFEKRKKWYHGSEYSIQTLCDIHIWHINTRDLKQIREGGHTGIVAAEFKPCDKNNMKSDTKASTIIISTW